MTRAIPAPSTLSLVVARPGRAVVVAWALLKGHWYKVWYPLRGIRFRAGRNLRVNGSLRIRGPGQVVFGDNIVVHGDATPWTHTSAARIVVGNNVSLGSTRFGCMQAITVGDDCLLASCALADSDFHSTRADRRSPEAPVRVAPIRLERNVWIGDNAGILPGTIIGENSVVGFGAVCMRPYPPNVVIVGNPGKVVGPIPSAPTASSSSTVTDDARTAPAVAASIAAE